MAGLDLGIVRLLVQAALAARLEFEVFDGVGHIDARTIDAGLRERAVEHRTGRTDEWLAGQILLVARLLADEHDGRVRGAFAEHGLGRVLVERTAAAIRGVLPRRRQAAIGRWRRLWGRGGEQIGLGLGVLSG